MCAFACALLLYPATPTWGVRCGCLCLGSGFGCAPPLLAGVLGCVCVPVCALRLYPATLGWVVLCGRGVAWHLFRCRGSLRVVRAARVCSTRWPLLLGTCPCALVVAGGVPLWRAWWPRVVRRASSGPVALGAPVGFPDALVSFPTQGACAPGFTGWLRGARGGRPKTGLIVPAAALRRCRGAGLAPRRTRVPPASVLGCVRCDGLRVWTPSLTRPVSRTIRRSTQDSAGAPGLFRVDAVTSPCGSEDATLGSRACVRVLVCPGRVGRAGLPGAFWCVSPFPLAALSFCFARPPRGWGCPFCGSSVAFPPPPLFFFLFVLSHFPRAPLVSVLLRFPAPGALGLGTLSFFRPPPLACVFFFFGVRPHYLWLSLVSSPGCPGPWRCVLFVLLASRSSAPRALSPLLWFPPGCWLLPGGCCPPSPPFVSRWFSRCRFCALFLFFFHCAPPLPLAFSCFRPRVLWAFALCAVCFVGLPLLRSPCALASFVFPAWPLAAPRWLLPPHPPLFCLAFLLAAAVCSIFFSNFFLFSRRAPPLSVAFSCFRPRVPWAL